jgi:hypothetical protein
MCRPDVAARSTPVRGGESPGSLGPVSSPDDDPTTQQLRAVQADREVQERERAEQAPTDTEQLAAVRRADKAAYLKEKLEEKAKSERS